jgi:hypothetical protein
VTLGLALLYLAWTFFSRWNDNRASAQASQAEKARANARIVEMYGSGRLKILSFYATSGVVRRGEKTLLCYGVANASAVRIEPGVEPLKPSLSRCVEISPAAETRYTLTAEDESGHKATESVVVRVLR